MDGTMQIGQQTMERIMLTLETLPVSGPAPVPSNLVGRSALYNWSGTSVWWTFFIRLELN